MPRPAAPDLRKDWKISLPATLAGAVEHRLFDGVTGKPRYGERSKLLAALLALWLEDLTGQKIEVDELAEDLQTPKIKEKLSVQSRSI